MSIESREGRRYIVTGEATQQDWDKAADFLGNMGLSVRYIGPSASKRRERKPSGLPYDLEGIKTRKQYVSIEHLFEFWDQFYRDPDVEPRYKKRAAAVESSFEALIRFCPKGTSVRNRHSQDTATLREKAGIDVVPRDEAGFPDYEHNRAGCKRDRMLVQAGGLIDFMKDYEDLPDEQRLAGMHAPGVVFLGAFAKNINSQIHPPQE